MSTTQIQQDIVFSNLLTLNFTYIEERLRKNFEIIASRMSKFQGLLTLDDRVRTLQKESKFIGMKIDNMALRLPENGANLNEQDIRNICNERLNEFMSPTNQSLKNSKFFLDLKGQVEKSILEKSTQKHRNKNQHEQQPTRKEKVTDVKQKTDGSDGMSSPLGKVPRNVLEKHLNKDELGFVDKLLKEDKTIEQIILETAAKLQSLERGFEEARMSRGVLNLVNRDIEKFDRYETYEQRLQKHQKKMRGTTSDLRTTAKDGDLRMTLRDTTDFKSANKEQLNQTSVPGLVLKDSRRLAVSRKHIEEPVEEAETEKMNKRNKSLSKLVMPERPEKRIRLEDPKDIGHVIRQIENRLDGKVSKEVFSNMMIDLEDRFEALRHSRQATTDYELRRYCNTVENRLQAVIAFIQQSQEDDDPIVAKKKWSCISCDKQAEKYSGKTGNHLNWDTLNAKKMSPTKAGAFGQTVLFANKVKNIIDQRKGVDTSDLAAGPQNIANQGQ